MGEPSKSYIERFRCGDCRQLHDDEDDARECCQPDVYAVLVCAACKKEFDEHKEKDAAACHPINTPASKCLCGNVVAQEDDELSSRLGSLTWCGECREQIENGVPAPIARDRSFARLAGIAVA